MKVLKWVVGVPVGIFVLMMVIGAFSNGPKIDHVAQSIANCYDDAQSQLSSDQAKAALIQSRCNEMQSAYSRTQANPTRIYEGTGPAK